VQSRLGARDNTHANRSRRTKLRLPFDSVLGDEERAERAAMAASGIARMHVVLREPWLSKAQRRRVRVQIRKLRADRVALIGEVSLGEDAGN
jgi:hypothetical protein